MNNCLRKNKENKNSLTVGGSDFVSQKVPALARQTKAGTASIRIHML